MWHAIWFHAALVGTLWGWEWRHLNRVCMTHAAGKIIWQLVDWSIGHPPRSVLSEVFGFRTKSKGQSHTEHRVIIALFALVPLCYVVEKSTRRNGLTIIYDVASYLYVGTFAGSYLVHTRPGYRLRSLWRTQHKQHIGTEDQLRVPLGTFVTYCAFWAVVLVCKLLFDLWALIEPLEKPIKGLMEYPFSRLMWSGCEPGSGLQRYTPMSEDALCAGYEVGLRWMLVVM